MGERSVSRSRSSYECPGIIGRKLVLCPTLAAMELHELVDACEECGEHILHCCHCRQHWLNGPEDKEKPVCHDFRVIFTDCACANNGLAAARSGIGLALGVLDEHQISIPITDREDDFAVRSNQRAELHAALAGLKILAERAETLKVSRLRVKAEKNDRCNIRHPSGGCNRFRVCCERDDRMALYLEGK